MKKSVALGAAIAMLLTMIFCARAVAARVIPTGAWGLCFPEEGKPPRIDVSADVLKEYDAVYLGNPEEKRIYLTFDAGYENGATEQILDALQKHHAPAAFFLVGNYLEQNPELVCRMVKEGHLVGNHTCHHPDMSRLSDPDAFSRELTDLEALYTEVTGEEMKKYYRPPQGIFSEANLRQAKAMGYRTVFWSLAYVDWKNDAQPTREEALDKLLKRVHSGAVVLLHSTSKTNGEIMDELLTRWEEQGYSFGTLEELYQ